MKLIQNLRNRIVDYIYDRTIDMKERMFVVFSIVVLIALFLAIPCGLIMQEPISATISTALGAIFFSAYVLICIKKKRIKYAKIGISFILVFLFLPAMFFTNGGVEGGTPLWLLLGTIYIVFILEGRFKYIMMICEAVVMIVTWIVGYFNRNLITEYPRGGNYLDTIAALFIVSAIIYAMISFQNSIFHKEEKRQSVQKLFSQTATALVNAIDSKDVYTQGHSERVAQYSRKIAEMAGKSRSECDEIYYIALLHDVGKIGIPEAIITKEGKLTPEEYEIVKKHSERGAQILQSISEYPYISIGAHFHHERYDGNGYPLGLKGTDIPEVARIIAVADAYDAMTSKRSYRDPIPQDKVREEIIEGTGTQFDPEFANIMLHLIDLDTEYEMKEREEIREHNRKNELAVGDHRDAVSDGIVIVSNMTTIDMKIKADHTANMPMPSVVLFDSLDGCYHDKEVDMEENLYFEYGEVWFDGRVTLAGARNSETTVIGAGDDTLIPGEYRIEQVKVKDHVLLRFINREKTVEVIIALPDSSRYAYMGLTGEHCRITDVEINKAEEPIANDYIRRIAEEISYINAPAGDIPNVQVDGYRSDSTDGIPIRGDMTVTFHTKSLPTARLVWHCPSYVIFSSADGKVYGPDYTEFSLVRLDGETWEAGQVADNDLIIDRQAFGGWEAWKQLNMEGYECTVTFKRSGRRIISYTENAGIIIKNITEIKVDAEEIYVAFSGDQCALTNIRIKHEIIEEI